MPLAVPAIHAEVAATYVKLHAPCAAHGARQRGGCGRDALLHAMHAPCARSPLSRLPHRSGCWARDSCAAEAENACPLRRAVRLSDRAVGSFPRRNKCSAQNNGGIALNAENWTRVRAGRVNRTQCLATEHAALEARCGALTRGRRRRGVALHSGLEIAHVSHRAGSCTVAQSLLPFQTPSRRLTCVSAGEAPNNVTMSRYLYNHGHQAGTFARPPPPPPPSLRRSLSTRALSPCRVQRSSSR